MSEEDNTPPIIPTGFIGLDRILEGGLKIGELVTLVGYKTNVPIKSDVMTHMALRCMDKKKLYVSLENPSGLNLESFMYEHDNLRLIPIRPAVQWFTCPKCGGHRWGTVSNMYLGDKRFDRTHNLGECHGDKETGIACDHVWDRQDDALYFSDKPEDLIT